jgi:hypothetical protein
MALKAAPVKFRSPASSVVSRNELRIAEGQDEDERLYSPTALNLVVPDVNKMDDVDTGTPEFVYQVYVEARDNYLPRIKASAKWAVTSIFGYGHKAKRDERKRNLVENARVFRRFLARTNFNDLAHPDDDVSDSDYKTLSTLLYEGVGGLPSGRRDRNMSRLREAMRHAVGAVNYVASKLPANLFRNHNGANELAVQHHIREYINWAKLPIWYHKTYTHVWTTLCFLPTEMDCIEQDSLAPEFVAENRRRHGVVGNPN